MPFVQDVGLVTSICIAYSSPNDLCECLIVLCSSFRLMSCTYVPFSAVLPVFGLLAILAGKIDSLLYLGAMAYCARVIFDVFLAHVLPVYGLVTILVGGLLYLSCISLLIGCFGCTFAWLHTKFLRICMLSCYQCGVCGHIGCRINSYFGCKVTLCLLILFIILEFKRYVVTLIQCIYYYHYYYYYYYYYCKIITLTRK